MKIPARDNRCRYHAAKQRRSQNGKKDFFKH